MVELKIQAECIRLALIAGLLRSDDVIRWADQEIGRASEPNQQLIDLACASSQSPKEMAHLLHELPGIASSETATNLFMALALFALDEEPQSGLRVIRALKRVHPDESLSASAAAEIDRLDDAVYLATSEAYGTVESVTQDLREYLEEFRSWQSEIPVLGAIS